MLDERMILLGLQETHLGVHEAILVEELECGLRHPDGHDPPVELDETRALVHVIVGEQDAEAGRLWRQLIWVVGLPIDLGLPSIDDIPQHPKTAQDALPTVSLVLKHMQEALDSNTGQWD
jgi:hypothetical protein